MSDAAGSLPIPVPARVPGWTGARSGGPVAPALEPGPADAPGEPGVGVPAADAVAPEDASGSVPFDPIVALCFLVILLAVCGQNWVLARRAEGASLLPDWLRPRRHRETR